MCLTVWISILFFFFFKQKTAYDMRISDWSSDVCSSDLGTERVRKVNSPRLALRHARPRFRGGRARRAGERRSDRAAARGAAPGNSLPGRPAVSAPVGGRQYRIWHPAVGARQGRTPCDRGGSRSEEHTSELQSLMRTSYAV